MVFLSRSLSFLGDFHFTVKVCLRWYTRCSLAVQAAVLILKPVLRISVFHQTNSSAGEGGRWRRGPSSFGEGRVEAQVSGEEEAGL